MTREEAWQSALSLHHQLTGFGSRNGYRNPSWTPAMQRARLDAIVAEFGFEGTSVDLTPRREGTS